MREIKFRVWGLIFDEYCMLPVSQLSWDEHDDGILRLHFCGSLDKRLQGSFGVHSGFGNVDGSEDTGWILMQYIGQKDKNGKEIYEGDIVKAICGCGHTENLPVCWHDGHNGYYLKAKYQHDWDNDQLNMNWAERFEVIGNIYNNPELLEAVVERG